MALAKTIAVVLPLDKPQELSDLIVQFARNRTA